MIRIRPRKNLVTVARAEMARRLTAAAIFYVSQHQFRVGVPYPRASRPGEYMRKRTGTGQKSVSFTPTTQAEIFQTLTIQIGYAAIAPYMPELEIARGRLGLRRTFHDLIPQLSAIVGAPILVRA